MSDPPADTTRASGRKRVIWDDSKSRNVYADAFNVMSSREEISLLLGTRQAGQKEDNTVTVELTDRVALSPFCGQALCSSAQSYHSRVRVKVRLSWGGAPAASKAEPGERLRQNNTWTGR